MTKTTRTTLPNKRERASNKARDENDDYKLDPESDTEQVSRKSRRQDPPTKRSKTKDSQEDAKPVKRSARAMKLAQNREAARQNAATANFATRFLKLPGEVRNIIYEMSLENNNLPVDMIHDTLKPDGPFDGYAPGRALTQVSQQVRAEFLLVYKRTTTICVHVEDLEEYIKTWLSGPASEGTIHVSFDSQYRDGRYRCAPEPKFQFWIYYHASWDESEKKKANVVPSDQSKYLDDIVERSELRLVNWGEDISFTHHLKPGYREQDCEKFTSDGSELWEWFGDVCMGVELGYSISA